MAQRSLRTQNLLRACALRLFEEQGFDRTTVAEIASAAGVSHMTFFRHFPTKEAVILDDPYDPLIATAVAHQPRDLRVLERVRRGLIEAWRSAPAETPDETRARVRIVAGHPALRASAWQNNQRTEEIIVEALVETGASRFEAAVASSACLGAVMAALMEWGASEIETGLGDSLIAALELLAPEEG